MNFKSSWKTAKIVKHGNNIKSVWNYTTGRVAIFDEKNVGRIFDIKTQNVAAEKFLQKLVGRKNAN